MMIFARVNDLKMQKFDKLIKNQFDSKCLTVKNRLSPSLSNLPNSFFRKNSRTGCDQNLDDKITKIKCVSSRALAVLSSECLIFHKNLEKNILPTPQTAGP